MQGQLLRHPQPAPHHPPLHHTQLQHRRSCQQRQHTARCSGLWPAAPHWQTLADIVWEGSEQDALLPTSLLSRQDPLWRLLLLSDGSVTRHLQLLTGSAVNVDCLSMAPAAEDASQLPPAVEALAHPLLQREVLLLYPGDDHALVHATSWWNVDQASQNLQDPQKPIWVSLSQARKELYREIQTVQCGQSPQLEQHFGTAGPFWGRQYLFWHGGRPLTLIHEWFSPRLTQYLSSGAAGSGNGVVLDGVA